MSQRDDDDALFDTMKVRKRAAKIFKLIATSRGQTLAAYFDDLARQEAAKGLGLVEELMRATAALPPPAEGKRKGG
jgi:hypothetical protein